MSKQMVEQIEERDERPVEASEAGGLTPEAFDQAFEEMPLWGGKRIASVAGVSVETVRRSWAKDPTSPIRRVGGRLCTWPSDLRQWLRARA